MSKKHSNDELLSSDYETTISLLNIYFSEWSHRDKLLWSQVYKYFYAILIVILLPNISDFLQIKLPNISTNFYSVCGLIFSFLFLYVSFGYLKRLEAIGNTYMKIIKTLPKDYQRITIEELHNGCFFAPRTSYFVCFTLFCILFFLSVILLLI